MQNRALQISISLIALFGLIVQCQPIDNRVPPNHDDVYEVRDSIRDVTLLRLGEALQIINRHTDSDQRSKTLRINTTSSHSGPILYARIVY